jgi:hypothetical protein
VRPDDGCEVGQAGPPGEHDCEPKKLIMNNLLRVVLFATYLLAHAGYTQFYSQKRYLERYLQLIRDIGKEKGFLLH